jgi:CDP-diglyceride synthetase
LLAGACLLALGSILALVFDWPALVTLLAIVPGFVAIEVGRRKGLRRRGLRSAREGPKLTWSEVAIGCAPTLVLSTAAPYAFDTTAWAWLAPIFALIILGFVAAEHLAWRRTSGPPKR